MADFRSVVEGVFHISVPQAELNVEKDGKVVLDHLEDDLRAAVEKELRKLPDLIEEGVERVQSVVDNAAKQAEADANALADKLAPKDKEQKAPEVDS